MVEDGHLSNSYQCGPSTYYLTEMKAKNDCCNNNSDSCVVVVERNNKHEKSLTPLPAPAPSPAPSNYAKANCTTNANCVSRTAANAHNWLPVTEKNSKHPSASLHFEKTAYHSTYAAPPTSTAMAQPTEPSNGSSHAAAGRLSPSSPSAPHHHPSHRHHFFDVTKDAECGGQILTANGDFPQELHKTVMAFFILIFNFFLTTTSLAIIHDKVPAHGPLPDTVLNMFEAKNWALIVSEVLIILTTGIMLIIVVSHKHRYIIFRRLFLMLSLLYFMRSVTMFVTVLPVSSSNYYCSPKSDHPTVTTIMKRSLTLFFGMGLTLNGKHTYCGDYIYSGHTTILVMSYLMISEYSPRRVVWLHWATWVMSLTGVLMVLLSHSHYTVDVIIGYFVTTRLFWMYHTCANNPSLKMRTRHNYLAREWWFFLFQYFECNVRGPLQPLEYR